MLSRCYVLISKQGLFQLVLNSSIRIELIGCFVVDIRQRHSSFQQSIFELLDYISRDPECPFKIRQFPEHLT